MKKQKKFRNCFACLIAVFLTLINCNITAWALDIAQTNGTNSFKQMIEFEDAKHFSADNGNAVRNDQFSGYSGSGYVYLASGWADVSFTVPNDGRYKITIVTTSDQYKENNLYLDNNSAGKLTTNANTLQPFDVEISLVNSVKPLSPPCA